MNIYGRKVIAVFTLIVIVIVLALSSCSGKGETTEKENAVTVPAETVESKAGEKATEPEAETIAEDAEEIRDYESVYISFLSENWNNPEYFFEDAELQFENPEYAFINIAGCKYPVMAVKGMYRILYFRYDGTEVSVIMCTGDYADEPFDTYPGELRINKDDPSVLYCYYSNGPFLLNWDYITFSGEESEIATGIITLESVTEAPMCDDSFAYDGNTISAGEFAERESEIIKNSDEVEFFRFITEEQ